MRHDDHDHAIVIAISQIAKTMNIACVAEWIEDEATLMALKEIGVDYGQGFYLHRPEAIADHVSTLQLPLRGWFSVLPFMF